jgi:hypothetical protein
MTTSDAFTLDATDATPMNELEVSWERTNIKNKVEVKMFPGKVDAGADTIVWKLQNTFPLSPGQVLVLQCPFRDPNTAQRISAANIVDPLVGGTHIKFGSTDDGSSNDLIANLTFPMDVGGNSVEITLTNTGAMAGYINLLEIWGDGIYAYEPVVLYSEDAASITARGERVLDVKLEQITNPNVAEAMAIFLKQQLADPAPNIGRVRFLANFNDEFVTAALSVEPNTRFAVKETQTGANVSLFACRLKFEQQGPLLWVEIIPAIAEGVGAVNYAIFDEAGHGHNQGVFAF